MIGLFLNWFVPFNSLLDPINPIIDFIEQAPRKKPRIEPVKDIAQSIFTPQDSFGAGSNINFGHKKNVTKISYSVSDITPLFYEPPRKPRFLFQFPDYIVGIVPEQFVIDFVRAHDVGYVLIANQSVPVKFSDPYLSVNGQSLSWHDPSDVPLDCCRDTQIFYQAPVVLTKLRELMGNDLDRFTFLTYILTQSPFNDMYKTIAAHIHERYQAIVLNGRGESKDNLLESPRLRSYEINITKKDDKTEYKVTATIAGYFSACSVPPGMELIERRKDKEIGWYCCKIEYDLDAKTAQAQHRFILNTENLH